MNQVPVHSDARCFRHFAIMKLTYLIGRQNRGKGSVRIISKPRSFFRNQDRVMLELLGKKGKSE